MKKWKIKWKGTAALFLCIAMVLGVFDGIPGMEGVMTTEVYAAGTANDLVSVAEQEVGNGYRPQYTHGAGQVSWCAHFVWWCAEQAGIPSNVITYTDSCTTMYNTMISRGTRVVSSPQRGDICFWTSNKGASFYHVGIMINSSQCVAGNTDYLGKKDFRVRVCESKYKVDGEQWFYLRPNYQGGASVKSESPSISEQSGNAQQVYTTETSFGRRAVFKNPNGKKILRLGMMLLDANKNEINHRDEGQSAYGVGSRTRSSYIWQGTDTDFGMTLTPGTQYYYKF